MDFGKALKVFQFQLLQQAGITVTPEQLGLKPDAIPGFGGGLNGSGSFANVLGQVSGKMPTAPTPPEDPSNVEAQAKFNREIVAYNQQLYTQNQHMLRQIMLQMSQLQRASQMQAQTPQSGISNFNPGVGGILEGDVSL